VQQVLQELKVQLELQARKELLVLKVQQVQQVRREELVLQELKVPLELQELKVQLVQQVLKVLQEQQERKVLQVLQGIVEEPHGHSILPQVIQTPVQGILGLIMALSVVFQKYL
jgi:hypothetical protein